MHKFYKSLASVTLATNFISPFDLSRIMDTGDEWVLQSYDLRMRAAYNKQALDKKSTKEPAYQRLYANGIAKCSRDAWYARFDNTVFLGDHMLRTTLPLVMRAIADGIMPHPSLLKSLHDRHDQAQRLDAADQGLLGKCSWVRALELIAGGVHDQPLQKPTITRTQAKKHWLIDQQYFEQEWYTGVVCAQILDANEKLQEKLKSLKDVDWSCCEYATVAPELAMVSGLPVFVTSAKVAKERSRLELASDDDSGDSTEADIKSDHDSSRHESTSFDIPAKEHWCDTDLRFLLGGGYIRYCKYVDKRGGQYGYSGKWCEPMPTCAALPAADLPMFNLPFHRETWITSSANLFVGWHEETIKKLQRDRDEYAASIADVQS